MDEVPTEHPYFSREEYDARLVSARERMDALELDALLATSPESIFYLCGLDHQGFFAFHMLVVPRRGPLTLVTRTMERATVSAQVPFVRFVGYGDAEDRARVAAGALAELGLTQGRMALEKQSAGFPPAVYDGLLAALPEVEWSDGSSLVHELRLVKSPQELVYTRAAARVTEAMMAAAVEAAGVGVNETRVAAAAHWAMIAEGGGTPGFGPFIRTAERLAQEHTTWRNRVLRAGDALFLEMSACVNRYHAPMGRVVFLEHAPPDTEPIAGVCLEAFDRLTGAVRPGATGADVYAAWRQSVQAAGIARYERHHCGYLVGLGFPPTWTGGSSVVGLRPDSDLELRPGMVFHLMSWLLGTGQGDYFVSNTAVLGDERCEVLTLAPPATLCVR